MHNKVVSRLSPVVTPESATFANRNLVCRPLDMKLLSHMPSVRSNMNIHAQMVPVDLICNMHNVITN